MNANATVFYGSAMEMSFNGWKESLILSKMHALISLTKEVNLMPSGGCSQVLFKVMKLRTTFINPSPPPAPLPVFQAPSQMHDPKKPDKTEKKLESVCVRVCRGGGTVLVLGFSS